MAVLHAQNDSGKIGLHTAGVPGILLTENQITATLVEPNHFPKDGRRVVRLLCLLRPRTMARVILALRRTRRIFCG